MLFYSTRNPSLRVSLAHAVQQGLAADGGLYMPVEIPVLPDNIFKRLPDLTLPEIAREVLEPYVKDTLGHQELRELCCDAFDFPVKLRELDKSIYALELFHGPTLAFKDFGARFMARLLARINARSRQQNTILVATSGDTGGAVARGFSGIENLRVVVLYPRGRISPLQERQMTTLGGNIFAVAIDGTFDDCQRLVKMAFQDTGLPGAWGLTSANSINVARLLPQMVYYFYAWARVGGGGLKLTFSVPSGNFGNLTAGIMAWRMGLPVARFLAATNANDIVPRYLDTGIFSPRPSVQTLSNAMDVGNPSNFDRLTELFRHNRQAMQKIITGVSYTDEQTCDTMYRTYSEYGYLVDPHGALAYRALKEYGGRSGLKGVFLETAHPGKFARAVKQALGTAPPLPRALEKLRNKPAQSLSCNREYSAFRSLLSTLCSGADGE